MGYIGSSTTDNDWYYQSFFADTDFIHLYLCAILVTLFYWNGTKFEISVVVMQFSEKENFVPFPDIQQLSKTAM